MFVKGTRIELANGQHKPIEALEPGDEVRGALGRANTVLALHPDPRGQRSVWSFNGHTDFFTWEQPFLTVAGRWVSVNPDATRDEGWVLDIGRANGAKLVHRSGARPVMALRERPGENPDEILYSLTLDGDHTFFANGYATHNKDEEETGWGAPIRPAPGTTPPPNPWAGIVGQTAPNPLSWLFGGSPPGTTPGTGGGNLPGGVTMPGMSTTDIEDSWIPGTVTAHQIYNQGQAQLDPNNYLDTVMQNLVSMGDPSQNPYLDSMLDYGQRNINDRVMSGLGMSGRGMTFDQNTGSGNDALANYIRQTSDFTNQFLGNQYQADMSRGLQANTVAADSVPSILSLQQNQPWNNLRQYADIVGTLTGSSPQSMDQPDGPSGLEKLIGFGTMVGGFL